MSTTKAITYEEAWEFAKRMEPRMKLLNAMNFSDMPYREPNLNIYDDNVQFFDPQKNEIHLGSSGVVDLFNPEDIPEFYNALLYVQGHEEQHRRSTASDPYQRAIYRGIQTVIEYIAEKEEGKKIRFRSERDYEDYLTIDLRKKGIFVPMYALQQISASIANSLEDGRIERIRSNRLPGFDALRILFRGKFWEGSNYEFLPYDQLIKDPVEHLTVLTNQILTLATCQLYQKGFLKAYYGTPVVEQVEKLMPYIAKAVMAGRARDLEPQCYGIMKELAPYIYNAYKLSSTDAAMAEALASMIADLIKQMVDKLPDTGLSERDEDTDDGSASSTFPHSDLVIELDDETYDKLVKNSSKSSGDGGIMIKRQHPKEEESGDGKDAGKESEKKDNEGDESDSVNENVSDGSSSSGSSEPDSTNSDGTAGSKSSSARKDKKDTSKNADGKHNSDKNSGNNSDSQSESSEAADSSDSKQDSESNSSSTSRLETHYGTDPERNDKGKANHENGNVPNASDKEADAAVEAIRKAIRDTKELTTEEAKAGISRVNEASAHDMKTQGSEVRDTERALGKLDVGDSMGDPHFTFREVVREYKTDHLLPPEILARGKALRRKNEKYFRSMKTPNVRNLPSGGVDPSRLYGLAIKNTEVFRKRGKDKLFDGCAYILIDNSGSMSCGAKFKEACTAAAVIEEGFKGLIPFKITSFSDSGETVLHQRIKGWDEKLHNNCCWNYYTHKGPGGGNADGCSIGVATKELLKRPEKKKLLVVLSDGQPTEGSNNPVKLTVQKVAEARKKGIKVVGIYFENGRIGEDAEIFKSIYGEANGIACTTSEIDKNLVRAFEKFARS